MPVEYGVTSFTGRDGNPCAIALSETSAARRMSQRVIISIDGGAGVAHQLAEFRPGVPRWRAGATSALLHEFGGRVDQALGLLGPHHHAIRKHRADVGLPARVVQVDVVAEAHAFLEYQLHDAVAV